MASDGVTKAVLKWEVDKRSVNDVIKSIDNVIARGEKLEGRLFDAWQTGRRAAEDAKKSFRATTTDIEGNAKAVKQLRDEYLKTGNAAKQAGQTKGSGFNIGRAESAVSRVGRSLSGLGLSGAGNAVSGAADILQLGEVAQSLAGVNGGFAAIATTLGPLIPLLLGGAAAAAILAKGLHDVNKVIEPAANAASHASKELDAYYEALKLGSKELIEARRVQLVEDKRLLEEELATRKQGLKAFEGVLGTIGSLVRRDVYDEQVKAVQDTEQALKAATAEVDGYTRAVNSNAVAAMEAARAERERHQATVDNFSQQTKDQLEIADLIKSGSSEQVKALIARKHLEKDLLAEEVANLNVVADSNEAAAKRIEELEANGKQLDATLHNLITTVLPLIEAREKEAAAIEDQKRIIDEIVNATKDYNADVKAITERGVAEEIAIKQKAVDRVADIVQKELDAATAALEKLESERANILADFGDESASEARRQQLDDLDQQIEAHRDQRNEIIDHQRKVQQMQRSFLVAERDALLDRNFLELFRIQENKKLQAKEADIELEQAKEDRHRAFADERQDTARHRAFERNERMIALNKSLAQAQQGYENGLRLAHRAKERELLLLNQATTTELNALAGKISTELSLRQSGYAQELQLARMTTADRITLLEAERRAVLIQASAFASSQGFNLGSAQVPTGAAAQRIIAGGRSYEFAEGGNAVAFNPFKYNDRDPFQRETFGGVKLPNGMGIAFPFKSGYVDPGKGGGFTLHQNITVQGTSNPEMTAQAVVRISRQESWKVQKEVAG